jgi:MFS family permease
MTVTEEMSDVTSRARTIGTYTVLFYVTAAIGPLVGGYLADAVGAAAPMLAFAAVATVGAIAAARHVHLAPTPGATPVVALPSAPGGAP